jgi:transcriptional regulator GlxA family with amidase domain
MVLYAHRPGKQSQFSELLAAQVRSPRSLSDVFAFIDANLSSDLRLTVLANLAGMSERTLHRTFLRAVGKTPARYIDEIRIERARLLLADGVSVKEVCRAVGFRSEQGFRKAFEKQAQISPSKFRKQFGVPDPFLPAQEDAVVTHTSGTTPDLQA